MNVYPSGMNPGSSEGKKMSSSHMSWPLPAEFMISSPLPYTLLSHPACSRTVTLSLGTPPPVHGDRLFPEGPQDYTRHSLVPF